MDLRAERIGAAVPARPGPARTLPHDCRMRAGAGSETGRTERALSLHASPGIWRAMRGRSAAFRRLQSYLAAVRADSQLAEPPRNFHVVARWAYVRNVTACSEWSGAISFCESRSGFHRAQPAARRWKHGPSRRR